MGDARRFDVFANFIHSNFPNCKKIADIAGGKGYLQVALRNRGYDVITFDKRKGRKNRPGKFEFQYRYFDSSVKEDFDLMVGMHPDEATDVIIVEAAKRNIPFAIVPCCVMPNAIPYWGQRSYKQWIEHLKKSAQKLGYQVYEKQLKMNGCNLVLYGRK